VERSKNNDHFFHCVMHASNGAHKIVLGQGMVKVGEGTEQVHAYLLLLLEFDSAVGCDITHCLEVM
jgi:hypothetical protein